MLRLVSAVVLSMALTAPAFADTTTPGAPPEQAAAKGKDKAPNKDGVVCTREIPTGSTIPVKVCTTAEQRKGRSRAVQSAQEHMQGSASTIPN